MQCFHSTALKFPLQVHPDVRWEQIIPYRIEAGQPSLSPIHCGTCGDRQSAQKLHVEVESLYQYPSKVSILSLSLSLSFALFCSLSLSFALFRSSFLFHFAFPIFLFYSSALSLSLSISLSDTIGFSCCYSIFLLEGSLLERSTFAQEQV